MYALKRSGIRVIHSKTEYMCVNEWEVSGTVKLKEVEIEKVCDVKCEESAVYSNRECGKEVKIAC